VLQNRMLKDGKLNAYWVMVNNNMQAAANLTRKATPATAIRTTSSSCPTSIRPSPRWLPTSSCPAAMWVEKEGAYGNAERRTHFWHQLVTPPGKRARTCGS
jgi:nitrate reductase NapA